MPTRADETNFRRFAAGALSGERNLRFFCWSFEFAEETVCCRHGNRLFHLPARVDPGPHGVPNT